MMKIITGLGNPEKKYFNTRHNVGWLFIDWLNPTATHTQKFNSQVSEYDLQGEKILLQKPLTYMNQSGIAVTEICNFYKVDFQKDLLVIQDEIDLPFGETRLSQNSSPAGHNGIKNISEKLGSQNFARVRIGVESRATRNEIPTETFVMQNFNAEQLFKLKNEIFPEIKNQIFKFFKK